MTAESLMMVGYKASVVPRVSQTRVHTGSRQDPDAIQMSEKGA